MDLGARLKYCRAFSCARFDERIVTFDNAGVAPNLDALPLRVVDQKQMRLRIVFEVTLRDVLPIASKIDEGNVAVIEHS